MRRRFGFTLIEAVLSGLLFTILAVIVWQAISFGIRAHRTGEAVRVSQATARQAVDILTSEIRSAVLLPIPDPPLSSSVLWPDPWGNQAGVAFAPAELYLREEVPGNEGAFQIDRVRNRLILSRAGRQVQDQDFNPNLISDHVLVEYLVPEETPHQLVRNVYRLEAIAGITLTDVTDAQGEVSQQWVVDPSLFDGGGVLESSQPVIELADTEDRIEFTVSHRTYEVPTDPGRTIYPEIFDPQVFTVTVEVGVGLEQPGGGPRPFEPEDNWLATSQQESQVRVQSAQTIR